MNCTSCGRSLSEEGAFCPACGAATPYNMPGQESVSQYNQTEASPYGNGDPQNYPPLPPTIAASGGGYPSQSQNPPYTNYGAGMPPQPSYDPYNTPPAYPPLPANPMGSEAYYGAPPISGYPQGMLPGMYNVPPKKRSKVGLIIGISVLALVLLCGGLLVAASKIAENPYSTQTSSNATATTSPDNTPTTDTTSTSGIPTSASVVPAAAKILFGVQTSNGVQSATYEPAAPTTTFPTGQEVDLTFQVNSAGKNGYIQVKWYEDGQEVTSDILAHHAVNTQGYFGQPFSNAGAGVAALYWCTKSDCSDEQLAQVANFTITGTAVVPSTNHTIAMTDWKRNND